MIGRFTLDNFYQSKEWRECVERIRALRVNEEGLTICEYCNRPIVKKYDCIGHHKEELTEINVNDVEVSLNADNIMLVHHKCHNVIHDKLGYSKRGIYIVYGAPLAGKHTYVESVKAESDLIIDIDNIYQCVSGCDRYVKSGRLKSVVFGVRDYLLDCIKYRRGKWNNAYIIGGYPLNSERERLAKELGAELIFIDTSVEECLKRLFELDSNDVRACNDWCTYIEDWFKRYTPTI